MKKEDLEAAAQRVAEAVLHAVHENHRPTRKCHARIAKAAAIAEIARAYDLGIIDERMAATKRGTLH